MKLAMLTSEELERLGIYAGLEIGVDHVGSFWQWVLGSYVLWPATAIEKLWGEHEDFLLGVLDDLDAATIPLMGIPSGAVVDEVILEKRASVGPTWLVGSMADFVELAGPPRPDEPWDPGVAPPSVPLWSDAPRGSSRLSNGVIVK